MKSGEFSASPPLPAFRIVNSISPDKRVIGGIGQLPTSGTFQELAGAFSQRNPFANSARPGISPSLLSTRCILGVGITRRPQREQEVFFSLSWLQFQTVSLMPVCGFGQGSCEKLAGKILPWADAKARACP